MSSGLALMDPWGVPQFVYPLLFVYACDHPEGCKVSIILTPYLFIYKYLHTRCLNIYSSIDLLIHHLIH